MALNDEKPILCAYPPGALDAIRHVAIAIVGSAETGSKEQRHLGLLLRTEDDVLTLVHLGWHYSIKIEIPKPNYCWLEVVQLNPVNAALFVDWCLLVAEENKDTVPYSMEYGGAPYFAEGDGTLQRTEIGSGLTCASFVLEMFNRFQMKLVDVASWSVRESDKPWTEKIYGFLSRTRGMTPEHLEAQKQLIGKVARFRPEEVAAAATLYSGKPMPMQVAERHGADVVEQMQSVGRL